MCATHPVCNSLHFTIFSKDKHCREGNDNIKTAWHVKWGKALWTIWQDKAHKCYFVKINSIWNYTPIPVISPSPMPKLKVFYLIPSWEVAKSGKSQLCWHWTSWTQNTNVTLTHFTDASLQAAPVTWFEIPNLAVKQTVNLQSLLQLKPFFYISGNTPTSYYVYSKLICILIGIWQRPVVRLNGTSGIAENRPHLSIILTRCSLFLFPLKSITRWPSV